MNLFCRTITVGLALLGILSALTQSRVMAQASDPGWVNLRVIEVKPDRAAEWEELRKERATAIKDSGGTPPTIWEVVRGEVDSYYILSFVSELGANDEAPSDLMGAADRARWGSRIDRCVAHRKVMTLRRLPQFSIPAREGRKPNLAFVSFVTMIPAKRQDYFAYLRETIMPALRMAKMDGVYVSVLFAGGSADTLVTATWLDKWSVLDDLHPLMKLLGQEEAEKILDKGKPFIARRERVMLHYRPDLSLQP